MNAREAAQNAETVRARRSADQKERSKNRAKEAAASWRKERAHFLTEFYNDVEMYIKDAVKDGKTSCVVEYLGKTGGARSPVQAEEWYQASLLRDIVEKVFQKFRGKGFSIKTFVGSSEHYVSYESSDEKYYTYHTDAKISWEK